MLWTVKLSTDSRSGAALVDPCAAVQLALVGEDGSTLLHVVPVVPHVRLFTRDACMVQHGHTIR